jgi:hypothetical protein
MVYGKYNELVFMFFFSTNIHITWGHHPVGIWTDLNDSKVDRRNLENVGIMEDMTNLNVELMGFKTSIHITGGPHILICWFVWKYTSSVHRTLMTSVRCDVWTLM